MTGCSRRLTVVPRCYILGDDCMTVMNFRFEESGADIHLLYWIATDQRTKAPTIYDFGEALLPAMVRIQTKEIHAEWVTSGLWYVDVRTRAVPEVKQFAIRLVRRINADKVRSTEHTE